MYSVFKPLKRSIPSIKVLTYILLHFLFLSICVTAYAQNPAREFEKIYNAYQKHTSITMDVSYKVFPTYTSASAIETSTGKMMRNGNSYYNKLLSTETIQNNNYLINVDHKKALIIVNKPIPNISDNSLPIKIDSLFRFYDYVDKVESPDGYTAYRIGLIGGRFREIEITFQNNTYLVNKIILYHRTPVQLDRKYRADKPRIEIVYTNINTAPQFTSSSFSESNYVKLENKKLVGNGSFSTYRIIQNKLN
jgi:hypothetical protein